MTGTWQALWSWTGAVLAGMAQPWVICVVLVLVTFLLEDVAIAAGAALATQGSLSWPLAFAAIAGGIALGDLGLYGLGRAARRLPFLRRRFGAGADSRLRAGLQRQMGSAVLVARVVPGLRLVTYTACGLFQLPLGPFCAWVAVAVAAWTAGLLWLSVVVGSALAAVLGIPAPVAVAIPVVALALLLAVLHKNRGMR